MYRPYLNKSQLIMKMNQEFGGKRVPVTDASIDYYKLLINCDRYMSLYVYDRTESIYSDYRDKLCEYDSSLIRSVSVPSIKAGFVQSKGDKILVEHLINAKEDCFDRAAALFNREVIPILEIHNSLLLNTRTMYSTPDRAVAFLQYAISNSLIFPNAYKDFRIAGRFNNNYQPKVAWNNIIRRAALDEDNKGTLYFPLLTSMDLNALYKAGFRDLRHDSKKFKAYCDENEIEIEPGKKISPDVSNRFRSVYYGWNSIPVIKRFVSEMPRGREALTIFADETRRSGL